MINKLYKHLFVATCLSLSGCMGVYEGGFECPAGAGVGCKSISEVNKMVNEGALPPSSGETPSVLIEDTYKCDICGSNLSSDPENSEIWINPLYLHTQQEKKKEKTQQKRRYEQDSV